MNHRTGLTAACLAASTLLSANTTFAQTGSVGPDMLGFSVENMDPSADPREDFYRYAVGGWLDRIERPEKYPI